MSVFRPRCGAQLTVAFDGRGAPNKIFTIDHVRPMEAKVSRNGYHEADTWNLDFDYRILPFDPEGIASIAVRIYMWNAINGDDGSEWAIDANEMIRGLADEPEMSIDASRNALSISGRDYTGILDPEWDARQPLPAGMPLAAAVQFIADKAAPEGTTARFEVVWDVRDDDGNDLPPENFLSNGAARSTKKKGLWVKPGKTTWEVIYDLVTQNGLICYVRDSQIIIRDARTLTRSQGRYGTPRLAYGRDLLTLKTKRKLSKERVPRIRIVYWDAAGQRQFETVYPARGTMELSPAAKDDRHLEIGLGLKKNEDLVIPAPSYCHDAESALRYAKMRWELMARSESTYNFKTRHLAVPVGDGDSIIGAKIQDFLGPGSTDYDLFRLNAGDAVSISFDPFNQEHMRAMDTGKRIDFLETLGYHPKVASFVAQNIEKLDQFQQPYYVRKAEFSFKDHDATDIEIEAVNFAYERREIEFADDPPDAITGAG